MNFEYDFLTKIKFHIKSTLETSEIKGITDFQVKWEFLKYEIRKFPIEFSRPSPKHEKRKSVFRK